MSAPTDRDTYANELVAAGAVWTVLNGALSIDDVEPMRDAEGQPTTALHVRFGFLKSRYRVTVTMDPDPEDES